MHQHLKQDGLQIEVFNTISFKKNDAQQDAPADRKRRGG